MYKNFLPFQIVLFNMWQVEKHCVQEFISAEMHKH